MAEAGLKHDMAVTSILLLAFLRIDDTIFSLQHYKYIKSTSCFSYMEVQ